MVTLLRHSGARLKAQSQRFHLFVHPRFWNSRNEDCKSFFRILLALLESNPLPHFRILTLRATCPFREHLFTNFRTKRAQSRKMFFRPLMLW